MDSEAADDIQLRICIIGHRGASGHRGYNSKLLAIQKKFYSKNMEADVKLFVSSCIHCVATLKEMRKPVLFGPAVHGSKSLSSIQFDFLEMEPSVTGMKYILIIRDDFSEYSWLLPFENTNSENAADGLLEWCSTFTVPEALMSDG